jgi:hypothetical protein
MEERIISVDLTILAVHGIVPYSAANTNEVLSIPTGNEHCNPYVGN